MHQNHASPFASDFYRRRGYHRELRSEDHFSHFRKRNRGSLAIFFAEEIAHLILVRSSQGHPPSSFLPDSWLLLKNIFPRLLMEDIASGISPEKRLVLARMCSRLVMEPIASGILPWCCDPKVGGQTRVDLATLAFFPCFTGFFGPVNDVNLIKTL